MFLGKYLTDHRGNLPDVPLPKSLAGVCGHYNVTALLPEDNTFGKGSLYLLPPETKCVVFDLDGTITVGGWEASRGLFGWSMKFFCFASMWRGAFFAGDLRNTEQAWHLGCLL